MGRLLVAASLLACLAGAAQGQCQGDLDRDGVVAINEIITAVNNSLAGCPLPDARFVDRRDGSIGDLQTGLVWEKKVGGDHVENYADPHDVDNRYTWAGTCTGAAGKLCQPTAAAAAACAAQADRGARGCDQCAAGEGSCAPAFGTETVWSWVAALNQSRFTGSADWRLATLRELQDLIDYDDGVPPAVGAALHAPTCGGGCTDLADPACSCAACCGDWSASTFAFSPDSVWGRSTNRARPSTRCAPCGGVPDRLVYSPSTLRIA